MKILVIGGAGYIGSHMLRCLSEEGDDAVAFDNLSTGHREAVGDVPLIVGDLQDGAQVRRALTQVRPDVVMHFAALSVVADSVREPLVYYRQNLGGTLTLLDAMRDAGVGRLVFSSTAALFGIPAQLPIAEDAPVAPINPYGWSKSFAERAIADACVAQGLRAVTLRYFNAAGAHASGQIGESHQPETHLIPNLLRAALGQGPGMSLFGTDLPTPDGTCVRDYVHVEDLCRAHRLAARALEREDLPAFQAYNLGSGQGYSVRQVLDAAAQVVGRPIPHQVCGRRPGDPPSLVASSARAKAVLGWTPQYTSIGSIIESAWRWHRAPRY